MGAKKLAVGVDLGGTKIAAGVFDSRGRLRGELTVRPSLAAGPAEGTSEALLGSIDQALASASVRAEVESVAIELPPPKPLVVRTCRGG